MKRVPGQVWRALTQPKRTVREAQVARDVVRTRRATAGWRPVSANGRSALIVSLSDHVYQLKLEGIFGNALAQEGHRPVVLSVRHARFARPYLGAFGIEDVVYPDEYEASGDDAEARRAVPDGRLSVQQLKELEFRGAKIGQQAISTLSRAIQRGRISVQEDPGVQAELRRLLHEAARAVLVSERLLDRIDPEIVLFNEKGYAGFGSVYDVALAREANVIQFVHAGIHWPDALLLKRYTNETRRIHPASLSAESWERVRALEWDERRERELQQEFDARYGSGPKHPDAGLQEGKRIMSAHEVRKLLALDRSKKTAVLFSHVLWDANLFYGEDLFEDMEEWFVESVRGACENPAVNWVIKLHPANRFKSPTGELNDLVAIRERVGKLPPHVKLLMPETEINTYSFFDAIDYAITMRGTVGIETPAFGIRTLTAGTGRYSGLGFTDDSSTADEYLDKLRRIHELPPPSADETLLGKRHAYGLFRLRPFRFTSYHSTFRDGDPSHPLAQDLDVTTRDPSRAPDLRQFTAWATGSELDYLRWPPS